MSENQDALSGNNHKCKEQTPRIEDSGNSSEGSDEPCMKRRKVLTDEIEGDIYKVGGEGEQDNEKKPSNNVSEETENNILQTEEETETGLEKVSISSESGATASIDVPKKKINLSETASSSTKVCSANYILESRDGKSAECPVCLNKFTTQEIGTPEPCKHNFCLSCLQEWTKISNTCPVGRRMFTSIIVRRCLEGKVTSRIPVEPPKQEEEEEEEEDYDLITCGVCGRLDREDRMFICLECNHSHHLECLDPPTDTVPIRERSCPNCNQTTLVDKYEEYRCAVCRQCDRQDSVINCFRCFRNYHLECLDPLTDTEPVEERVCPKCNHARLIHRHEEPRCSVCRQNDFHDEDSMRVCVGCFRYYHLECVDTHADTVPLEELSCPNCNEPLLINYN